MSARYLLDVSALIALLWESHEHNERATRWQEVVGTLAVCPITEIGFLRISTQPAAFGATVEQAREMLRDWKAARKPEFIPCDIEALRTLPASASKTTDFYLAGLAQEHGIRLATFDDNIGHPAAFSIPA